MEKDMKVSLVAKDLLTNDERFNNKPFILWDDADLLNAIFDGAGLKIIGERKDRKAEYAVLNHLTRENRTCRHPIFNKVNDITTFTRHRHFFLDGESMVEWESKNGKYVPE
jgi:hypothetical protein